MSSSQPPRPVRPSKADAPSQGSDRANPNPAKPMPKPNLPLETIPPRLDSSPGSSASGFVGMLARGKLGSGDSHMPELSLLNDQGKPPKLPKYQLRMAREIPPHPAPIQPAVASTTPAIPRQADDADLATAPAPDKENARSHASALLATLAFVLMSAGLWASGALLYMSSGIRPNARGTPFPFVQFQPAIDGSPIGRFSRASWVIAWCVLPCLPLAAACFLAAAKKRTRQRNTRRHLE